MRAQCGTFLMILQILPTEEAHCKPLWQVFPNACGWSPEAFGWYLMYIETLHGCAQHPHGHCSITFKPNPVLNAALSLPSRARIVRRRVWVSPAPTLKIPSTAFDRLAMRHHCHWRCHWLPRCPLLYSNHLPPSWRVTTSA